jgi:hypothetical protein
VESLPAAGTVRRTVRVAVALVVGQVLLVGLIGWLTLGRGGSPAGAVDQMAAPPAIPPPTITSQYVDPPAPPVTSIAPPTSVKRATPGHRTAPTHSPSPPRPVPPQPPPPAPSEPTPTIVVTPTIVPPGLAPVVTPSPSEAPGPVVVGDRCAPEGAYAHTADGVLVRCVRLWHHRLRWKIV